MQSIEEQIARQIPSSSLLSNGLNSRPLIMIRLDARGHSTRGIKCKDCVKMDGWIYNRRCKSCGRNTNSKPSDSCKENRHPDHYLKYYARRKALGRSGQSRFLRYGLSVNGAIDLWAKQGGLCPICKDILFPLSDIIQTHGKKGWINADHDHKTGSVRALLHARCNQALANVQEDPNITLGLLSYIQGLGNWFNFEQHATNRIR